MPENLTQENQSIQTDAKSIQVDNSNKSNNYVIIALIAVIVIISVVFSVSYITNKNNKKLAQDRAIDRINQICDNIDNKQILDIDYHAAEDQLSEIKALIDENNLEGLPVTKYNNTCDYINDIKKFNKLQTLLYSGEYSIDTFKSINNEFRRIKTQKVKSYIANETEMLIILEDYADRIITAKAVYAIQEKFRNEHSDSNLVDIAVLRRNSSRGDFTGVMNMQKIDCSGIHNYYLSNPDNISNIDSFVTQILTGSLEQIDAKNKGYAFVVVYREPTIDENAFNRNPDDYWKTSNLFWYVGFDVFVEYNDTDFSYNITRYADNNEENITLSADELLNYKVINITENSRKPPNNNSESNDFYRVRNKNYDESSQIGAYKDFNNAARAARDNPGYVVFDMDGNIVFDPSQED